MRDRVLEQGWWDRLGEVAGAWQQRGVRAHYGETWALFTGGAQRDRPTALLGLMESAGEQFALAAAAIVEAKLWQLHREACAAPSPDDHPAIARAVGDEMAQRAAAESAMFSLLAVGHAIANVIARALTFTPGTHATARTVWKLKDDHVPFEPWSEDRRAWLSLNPPEVDRLVLLADAAPEQSVRRAMPLVASAIVDSPWTQLKDVRDTSWHRSRRRTLGMAGAPGQSLWLHEDGKWVLSVGARSGEHTPDAAAFADPAQSATALTDLVLEVALTMAEQMQRFGDLLDQLYAEHRQPTVEQADPEAAGWSREISEVLGDSEPPPSERA